MSIQSSTLKVGAKEVLVHCVCGLMLRVAGSWTCWRCGTCHRLFERDAATEPEPLEQQTVVADV